MGLRTRTLCGTFALGAILIGQAGACSGDTDGASARGAKLSCGVDGDCATGDRCQAGQCVAQGSGGAAGRDAGGGGGRDASTDSTMTEDVAVDAVDAPACVRAPCGRGRETCCPGFECKSLDLYNCLRATRDPTFCREQTDWKGTCYAKDDVPCDPAAIGLPCPNIPLFGPAPANATCCAPLGTSGQYSCVDPSTNPTYCAQDGATATDGATFDAGPAGPPNDGTCAAGCTGGCAAGRCWYALVPGDSDPYGIVNDKTHLYFANAGAIKKVPLSGGAVSVLASGQADPIDLAIDATSVYFVNYRGGTVAKVPLTGGTPIVLASGQFEPSDIAVNGTSVYWTTQQDHNDELSQASIMKLPLAGGTPQKLAVSTFSPADLALDGTNLYWAATRGVTRLPLAGGTPSTLAPVQGDANGIALQGDTVYFTSFYGTPRIDGVLAVPRGGGTVSTLVLDQWQPSGIAVDATHVYWTNVSGPQGRGTIAKAPLAGGAPTTLATDLDAPREIVVDATSVYFTTSTAIIKLSPK